MVDCVRRICIIALALIIRCEEIVDLSLNHSVGAGSDQKRRFELANVIKK